MHSLLGRQEGEVLLCESYQNSLLLSIFDLKLRFIFDLKYPLTIFLQRIVCLAFSKILFWSTLIITRRNLFIVIWVVKNTMLNLFGSIRKIKLFGCIWIKGFDKENGNKKEKGEGSNCFAPLGPLTFLLPSLSELKSLIQMRP